MFGVGKMAVVSATVVTLVLAMSVSASPAAQAASPERPSSIATTLTVDSPVPSGSIFVSPTGSDANPGTASAPLRTVNYAATKARAGGTVVLRGGVYREGAAGHSTGGTKYIIEPKNLTIRAYPGEVPWMDGTVPVTSWTKVKEGDYKAAWSTPDFCSGAYYSRHYANQTSSGPCSFSDSIGGSASLGDPQMVFVGGQEIREVASAAGLTANTFYYDWNAREVHLGFNPSGKTVEVTKYPQALALFKPSNVTIRGIGIRRYASNQYGGATSGALLLNGGSNVTLDRVVVTQSAGNGMQVWNTRNLTVRSSWLSNNGATGMNFAGSAQQLTKNPSVRDDLVIEYSRLDNNNADAYAVNCSFSCSAAGFKGAGVVGANVRYNTFNANGGRRASGVWFDLDAKQVTIVGNEVIGNARHGIVYEVSDTGIIASNLISDNGWNSAVDSSFGLMVGSANTQIYNNTIMGNKYGVLLYDDSRSPGAGTGLDPTRVGPNSVNVSFVNNIVNSPTGSPYLMVVTGGKSSVAGNTSADQLVGTMNHNSYGLTAGTRFVTWRQHEGGTPTVFGSLAALRSATGKETNGFQGVGSVNAAATPVGAPLPANVAKALGKTTGAVLPRGMFSTAGVTDGNGGSSPDIPGTVEPGSPVVRDAFSRTVGSGWGIAEVGGTWTVNSGSTMSVNGSSAAVRITGPGSTRTATLNSVSVADVSIVTDLTLDKAPVGGHYYHQLLARVSGSTYYRLTVRLDSSGAARVYISKVVSGSETVLKTAVLPGFNYSADEQLKVRFDVSGGGSVALVGKMWRARNAEPASSTVAATDSSSTLKAGGLGLKMYTGGGMTSLPLTVKAAEYRGESRLK